MARKTRFTADTACGGTGILGGHVSPIASDDPHTVQGAACGTLSTRPPEDVIRIVDDYE